MLECCRVYCTGDKTAVSTTIRATEQASSVHQAIVEITIQLKQLELLAAEIEESANRASAAADVALRAAEDAQSSLEAAQRDAQVNIVSFCSQGIITGPPAHSVGGQYCFARRASVVVVCRRS